MGELSPLTHPKSVHCPCRSQLTAGPITWERKRRIEVRAPALGQVLGRGIKLGAEVMAVTESTPCTSRFHFPEGLRRVTGMAPLSVVVLLSLPTIPNA